MADLNLIPVGTLAPDFALMDQNGSLVSLQSFRHKKWVALYFYPKALTPGCTTQACGIRDFQAEFNRNDLVVLGVSADQPSLLKKFEVKKELNFTLLSDPDHSVCKLYGIWAPKKFMGREFLGINRVTYLISPEGKVVHIINPVKTSTHHQELLDLLRLHRHC